MYRYYIMSRLNHHALGVIEENETTITVQKLKIEKVFDAFTNSAREEIVADYSSAEVNNALIPKDDLSVRINEVEITKDYWTLFEYLTGRKRKAVAPSSELA